MTEGSGDRETRSAYLIDGRRVTVSDLLDAGLVNVGAGLRFSRPRIGDVHRAVVTADGRLRLEDGQEYASSSRAAAIVADMRAVDGWHAWVVDSTGASLDSLRQALLDQIAIDERAATAPAACPQTRSAGMNISRRRVAAPTSAIPWTYVSVNCSLSGARRAAAKESVSASKWTCPITGWSRRPVSARSRSTPPCSSS